MKIKQQLRQARILRTGGWMACVGLLFLMGCLVCPPVLTNGANAVIGTATASITTLTLDVATHNTATLNLTPIPGGGTFATSFDDSENNENSTISVTTNNFKGYTLSIKASTTGDNASRLINSSCLTDAENNDHVSSDDCYIESLGTVSGVTGAGITKEVYSAAANTQYNNTWAYLPSKYNSTDNTNYLPAPTVSGDILMVTNVANATADVYTIAMGARVDTTAPKGTYQNTFTVMAVGNPAIYDISYNANAGGDTVNGMPSAQTGEITGDTSGSVTLSNSTPARDGYIFAGWNLSSDGTGAVTYQPGGSFGIDQTDSNSGIVLYAMWTGCAANTICYVDNGAGSVTKMNNQSVTSGQDSTLWASNFQRSGYGFAGWNTKMDGTGTNYGPNQTISVGDLSSSGLILYANWVASAGNLQDWGGCATNLASGYMTALTDTRDNSTYAVAKLADGNCWMIENLRLGNTYNNNGTATAVALDSTNTQGLGGMFNGLADSEAANFGNVDTANSVYTADTTATNLRVIEGSSVNTRFPRFNNSNTANAVASMAAAGQNVYSYGNYYTWAAAMANTSQLTDASTSEAAGTSLCPKGWQLPIGGVGTSTNLSFSKLDFALGGDGGDQTNAATSYEVWRSYPNNFLYSGEYIDNGSDGVGNSGWYWSTSASSDTIAYRLSFGNNTLSPGGAGSSANKYYGMSVRCVMAASTPSP